MCVCVRDRERERERQREGGETVVVGGAQIVVLAVGEGAAAGGVLAVAAPAGDVVHQVWSEPHNVWRFE